MRKFLVVAAVASLVSACDSAGSRHGGGGSGGTGGGGGSGTGGNGPGGSSCSQSDPNKDADGDGYTGAMGDNPAWERLHTPEDLASWLDGRFNGIDGTVSDRDLIDAKTGDPT